MAVLSYSLRSHGNAHLQFANAIEKLSSEETMHQRAYRRALNKTGDKAYTRVIRAVGKQTGLKRAQVIKYGDVKKRRASYSRLDFEIVSRGLPIPLREFSAKQFSFGVRARPWGKVTRFPSAFIYAGRWNSGKFVGAGHVFQRTTSASLPIERLDGPSIPQEIVKDQSADAFNQVADELPNRIAHELRVITDGIVG